MTEKIPRKLEVPPEKVIDSDTEEWYQYREAFQRVRELLYEKMKQLSPEAKSAIYRRLREKGQESFATVSDPGTYLAYHVILSGGTDPVSSPNLDFEGEHSLLKFHQQLLDELDA